MSTTAELVRIRLLGLKDQYFTLNRSFLEAQATKLRGALLEDPPPFAAACTDGILVLFNIQCAAVILGACVEIPLEELGTDDSDGMRGTWARAHKPKNMADAKRHFQFGVTRH